MTSTLLAFPPPRVILNLATWLHCLSRHLDFPIFSSKPPAFDKSCGFAKESACFGHHGPRFCPDKRRVSVNRRGLSANIHRGLADFSRASVGFRHLSANIGGGSAHFFSFGS